MAGIGFSLKRLFSQKGFFSLCRAYGYAGIICAGPMILGVVLLAGMSMVARIAGMPAHERELMNCMLTYSLLVSLSVTSWFNMIATRYVSDMLYEEKPEKVMPSFYGCCAIMLAVGEILYGCFLFFSGVPLLHQLLCLLFSAVLIVVWTQMIYLTALKDYRGIILAFTISLMVGFLCALILVILGKADIVTLMTCVILSYGILMVWYYKLLLDYFPKSQGSRLSFLGWFDRYPSLAFIGGFVNLGLFAHLVIMYFGPLRVQVEGLFYGAPSYDVPALAAFFSILVTTVNFVTSVEVRFYPTYRNYYSLFNDKGSIRDIEQAEEEMLTVLGQELTFGGHKQLITTLLFVVLGSYVLEWLPVGLTSTGIGIFRFLCVGYGVYAVSNSVMLVLLYFEDYGGALAGTLAFAAVSILGTIWQILYGQEEFYGMGFLAGSVIFYFIVWGRLEWYTRKLPYFLLCRKSLVPGSRRGIFTALCGWRERRKEKKNGQKQRRRKPPVQTAALLIFLVFLAGCQTAGQEQSEDVAQEAADEKLQGTPVEKETPTEEDGSLRENKEIYQEDDDTSVVTMYLTVRQGNEADHTNHTWSEINTYSAYYYDENNLDRYNCEAILQVGDESGPLEGEFGFSDTIPNATVQIRGQTSSRYDQKNYKIRIKDGMGEWRGQRTIALNKHEGEPVRFRNKLAYDLIKQVPEMFGARTQFVHLYVKDETEGGSAGFQDYGLYTQVEQINKTYLKNHGLDSSGHLYKINFFEWHQYEDALMLKTDPEYDEKAFEEYLEIKGNDDHTKLLETLREVNDYSIPIQEIVEKHFDMENICYWFGFHILTGNYDVGSRNYYLYSPLNSEKWYFISWDNDSSFTRTYYRMTDYSDGQSWEQGMSQFLHIVLFNRIFQEEQYREALTDAIEDLRANYLDYETVNEKVQAYAELVKPFVYRMPDLENVRADEDQYDEVTAHMAEEVEENYGYYLESLKKPWPFYIATPRAEGDQLSVSWEISYDINEENIEYEFVLASDYRFENVLYQVENIWLPEVSCPLPEPGQYYVRVRARNESGYEQDCFDYWSVDEYGKFYGAKAFQILEDGTITDILEVE